MRHCFIRQESTVIKIFILFLLIYSFISASAQDSAYAQPQKIDPSKPTNLYTQVNAGLNYQSGKTQHLFGV
jgi:hypothetical protein